MSELEPINGHDRAVEAREELRPLAARLLADARSDLSRPTDCSRYLLARAWVSGRYSCGCPYESAGPTFADVCTALGLDHRVARIRLVGEVSDPIEHCVHDGRLTIGELARFVELLAENFAGPSAVPSEAGRRGAGNRQRLDF